MDEDNHHSRSYAYTGKAMLISVIILFIACLIIILLHIYSHRFRCHHRQLHHLRRLTTTTIAATPQGLDTLLVKSLPTFIYASKDHSLAPLECAVCLSEFEENETGRILPDCNHSFHVGCIDSWLRARWDCPLCRTRVRHSGNQVEVKPTELDLLDMIVPSGDMNGLVTGSGSHSCPNSPSSSMLADQVQSKVVVSGLAGIIVGVEPRFVYEV